MSCLFIYFCYFIYRGTSLKPTFVNGALLLTYISDFFGGVSAWYKPTTLWVNVFYTHSKPLLFFKFGKNVPALHYPHHYCPLTTITFFTQLCSIIASYFFSSISTLDTFDQRLNAELAASTAFSKSITPDSGYLHNASPVLGFNVSANLPSSGGTNSPLIKL